MYKFFWEVSIIKVRHELTAMNLEFAALEINSFPVEFAMKVLLLIVGKNSGQR